MILVPSSQQSPRPDCLPDRLPLHQPVHPIETWGVPAASLIFCTWAISLVVLLRLDLQALPLVWRLPLILWQMFLYTGLFITAHDAMHGAVAPQNLPLNHRLGSAALLAYGMLSYRRLRTAHQQHHLHPASEHDPDFHDGQHQHVLRWYARFMVRYWNPWQWIGLVGSYHFLHRVVHVPEANLLFFWAIPSLLSSVQLFYFGTFLAHRRLPNAQPPASTNSIYRPFLWSFITCYHFGYHREHHDYPEAAWWQLPAIAQRRLYSDR